MDLAEAKELDFEVVLKETEKALQIRFSSAEIKWLPKSQCRILGSRIYLPEWLVKSSNLESFVIPE